MIGQADIAKAVNAVWDASTLDATFKALWAAGVDADEFPVLHEKTAGGGQPFPYCVFDMPAASTKERMSKAADSIWEIRDQVLNFRVHAREVSGDARTAKKVAADLAEEIAKVFGGHPTVAPTDLTLDNGNFLQAALVNDWGMRDEDEEHHVWTLSYQVRVDVPVMT